MDEPRGTIPGSQRSPNRESEKKDREMYHGIIFICYDDLSDDWLIRRALLLCRQFFLKTPHDLFMCILTFTAL